MGLLFLPSLEEKRFIRMEDVSVTEAKEFIAAFDAKLQATRKLKSPVKSTPDSALEYYILSNLIDYDLDEIVEVLIEADIPGTRGSRAVFIDVDTDLILVGTSIVYSRNWATMNVLDDTIVQKLFDLQY